MGQRKPGQPSLWVSNEDLPRSPGHPFYQALNRLLHEAGFDRVAENACAEFYAKTKGRPSIPPGVYFRMLMVGYFEGLDSQRSIAWRCSDSLSLRAFLGVPVDGKVPDHSSLTVIRQRLSHEVHERVFQFVLEIAKKHGLLSGRNLAVDSTFLEANAAMRSIVRRESGEDWKAYLRRLATEAGVKDPTDEDLRRMDRQRGSDKKTSNADWVSRTDPESRIQKMKDGRTHLAYKAEHAVDVVSEVIVAAEVWSATEPDTQSLVETVAIAQRQALDAGCGTPYVGVVADKGYYSLEGMAHLQSQGLRTYIPEPRVRGRRRWANKPQAWREAALGNRRRVRGNRGRQLNRLRSERIERSFAHVCETGRARRTWLRGRFDVSKRYLIQVAARNLGTILRKLFGVGTPRGWAAAAAALCAWLLALGRILSRCATLKGFPSSLVLERAAGAQMLRLRHVLPISTGC